MLQKGLKKPFYIGITIHARYIRVILTTGPMNHKLFDKLKQLWIVDRKLK
jgi:hypothetical protein